MVGDAKQQSGYGAIAGYALVVAMFALMGGFYKTMIGAIIVTVVVVIYLIARKTEYVDEQALLRQELDKKIRHQIANSYPAFEETVTFESCDKNNIFSYDEHFKKVCFLSNETPVIERIDKDFEDLTISDFNYNVSTFDGKDIISSEIVIDDKTVTTTSRLNQAGGVLIGGFLLGGTGAVIGGLSSKKQSVKYVSKIMVKITVNDVKNPIRKIVLFNERKEQSVENKDVEKALEQAQNFYATLSVIAKQ